MSAYRDPLERTPLSRDRIVDSALELARREGMAGVSMRRLGRELGVQPMSLYHHIPSRAVLMVLMAARSVSNLNDPDPSRHWQDQLIDLLMQTYRAGIEDPAVFPVLASESLGSETLPPLEPETGAASIGLIERILALLADGGVPAEAQLRACRGLIGLVVGFIVGQVDGLSPTAPAQSGPAVRAMDWPEHRDLETPAVVSAMHSGQPGDDLRFNLEMFVRGLQTTVTAG